MPTETCNLGNQNTVSGQPKSHIMVTLPPTLRLQVEQLADKEQRSLSYICRRFVEQGLKRKSVKQ